MYNRQESAIEIISTHLRTFRHLANPDDVRPVLQRLDEEWICNTKDDSWPAKTPRLDQSTIISELSSSTIIDKNGNASDWSCICMLCMPS